MNKACAFSLLFVLLSPVAWAQQGDGKPEVKEISGMSIVGDDEAPKSLFIVPWKSSEIGFESGLTAKGLLDGSLRPLDKEVFNRELNYYDIRSSQ